jgi:hypothetical protein
LSSNSLSNDKSTSTLSIKSLGRTSISISLCNSSKIAPCFTASDSPTNFNSIFVFNFSPLVKAKKST